MERYLALGQASKDDQEKVLRAFMEILSNGMIATMRGAITDSKQVISEVTSYVTKILFAGFSNYVGTPHMQKTNPAMNRIMLLLCTVLYFSKCPDFKGSVGASRKESTDIDNERLAAKKGQDMHAIVVILLAFYCESGIFEPVDRCVLELCMNRYKNIFGMDLDIRRTGAVKAIHDILIRMQSVYMAFFSPLSPYHFWTYTTKYHFINEKLD